MAKRAKENSTLKHRLGLARLGLQARIGLLVALPLIVVFVAFAYISLRSLEQTTQHSLQERLLVTQLIAGKVDEHLGRTLQSLRAITLEPALQQGDWEPAKAALRSLAFYSGFPLDNVFIVDSQGREVWNDPASHSLGPLQSYPSVRETLEQGQARVSGLVFQAVNREPRVVITVPVLGAQGQVLGALGGALDPTQGSLSNLVAPLRLGQSGYAELVDERGIVLASARPERLFQKDDHADRFYALIQRRESRVAACHRCHETGDAQRQRDILAFSPIANAPWGIAVRQLETEALAATTTARQQMLILGGPLVLVAVYISWLTTRHVVRPIRELTAASQRIAVGDLDFAVNATSGDEIGTLASSFDTMRSRLKESQQVIEEWQHTLEARVERRTQELSTVLEAAKIATSTVNLDHLLSTVMERLTRLVGPADAGLLYFYDEEKDRLVVAGAHQLPAEALKTLQLRPGEGLAGRAFLSRQAVVAATVEEVEASLHSLSIDNRLAWLQASRGLGQVHSAVAGPLIVQNKSLGSLELVGLRPEVPFTISDLPVIRGIADQLAVAIQNARLYQELQEKEALRGHLLERVISAQEEERKRIARELHDEAGQSLTALNISLSEAMEALPAGGERAAGILEQARHMAEGLLAEIRRLISDLRPTVLDELGLIPALKRYAKTCSEVGSLEVQVKASGPVRRLSPQVETALYRIAQEALNNVTKHARARRATVYLNLEDSRVTLTIEDDGQGFDLPQMLKFRDHSRGWGLLGMQERATLFGGTFQVESQPGLGTRITVHMPLAEGRRYVQDTSPASR